MRDNRRGLPGMTRVMRFLADESGAATVDWVVLTAASVAMGLAVMGYVREGVESLADDIHSHLSSIEIRTSFAEWEAFREAEAED